MHTDQLEELREAKRTEYDGDSPGDELTKDELFDVLSNPRRRFTIRYLNQTDDGTVRLRTLAEQLAAWENGVSMPEVNYKQRKRVYISLYQTHLPKMDQLGIIEYDGSSGLIRSTPELEKFYEHIGIRTDEADRWNRLTLSISAACFALVAAAVIGILPLGGGSALWLALGVSMAVLLASVAQYGDSLVNA